MLIMYNILVPILIKQNHQSSYSIIDISVRMLIVFLVVTFDYYIDDDFLMFPWWDMQSKGGIGGRERGGSGEGGGGGPQGGF